MNAVVNATNENGGEYIETYTGRTFPFLHPTESDFDIVDIAHALSNTGRYNGHCKRFYSVAEHSYHVSFIVPPHLALEGLLHDASEAYLTDVASPIKYHLTGYKVLEDGLMNVIAKKWGFSWPVNPEVKRADVIALSTESNDLIASKGNNWFWPPHNIRPTTSAFIPWCWAPSVAEEMFLKRFYEIL